MSNVRVVRNESGGLHAGMRKRKHFGVIDSRSLPEPDLDREDFLA